MNRTGASAVMTDYASVRVGRHAKGLKGEGRGMIKIFIGAILALLDITVTNGSMRFQRHANDWRQQGQRCLY